MGHEPTPCNQDWPRTVPCITCSLPNHEAACLVFWPGDEPPSNMLSAQSLARFVPAKICFNIQHASMKFNRMLKPWSSSCWSPYFLYLLILPQVESSPRCAAVLTVVLASSKTIARMTSIIIAPAKIRKSNHHCKLSQIITFVRVTKIFRQVTLVSSWGYGLPLPELKVQVHQAALIMAGRLLQFVFICIYYDH